MKEKDKNMQDKSAEAQLGLLALCASFPWPLGPLAVVSVMDGTATPSLAQARENTEGTVP